MAVMGPTELRAGGDISTEGLFRFSDFINPVNRGGTGDFKKIRGTVTLDNGEFTFRGEVRNAKAVVACPPPGLMTKVW
jgi:hypothetical protein